MSIHINPDKKEKFEEFLKEDDKAMLPGGGLAFYQFDGPDSKILNTFPAPHTIGERSLVTVGTFEMGALCPLTSFPDWYKLKISYIPNKKCIESKSAKFYFHSYRDFGGFIETIADSILKHWVEACDPLYAKVDIIMNPRGGVDIRVEKEYTKGEKN